MRSAKLSQWLLSLLVEPKVAEATVGDLLEMHRGRLGFWYSVLRIAVSHLTQDFRAAPVRMIGYAFWGFGASLILGIFLVWTVALIDRKLLNAIPPWEVPLGLVCFFALAPLRSGWALARRAWRREVAAALATMALFAAWYLLSVFLSDLQMRRIGKPWPGMEDAFVLTVVKASFFLAGALWYRIKTAIRRLSPR
ncbi:hypothetical protein [uncultured Paludibaculum sp.]|uniref:hypothetical protein n=1 Tax=uncultured Paludibaculum sp. TaxID=1765020 RepID=UPI002AAB8030|nr:hypothetical protein [uncultured Paludibaculum sp.]